MCNKLGLKVNHINHKLTFIDQNESNVTEMTRVSLKSKFNDYTADINCLILNKITESLPLNSFSTNNITIPNNINLADAKFNISRPIDLLIGSELFLDIFDGKVLLKPLLYLHNSKFGWILSGPLNLNIPWNLPVTSPCNYTAIKSKCELEELNKQVIKFWDVEDYQCAHPVLSQQDIVCETHFTDHSKRDESGRFWVSLPTNDNHII